MEIASGTTECDPESGPDRQQLMLDRLFGLLNLGTEHGLDERHRDVDVIVRSLVRCSYEAVLTHDILHRHRPVKKFCIICFLKLQTLNLFLAPTGRDETLSSRDGTGEFVPFSSLISIRSTIRKLKDKISGFLYIF